MSVRLEYSLRQKHPLLLQLLYNVFNAGSLTYTKGADIWTYKSTGCKTAYLVLSYFDNYRVYDSKFVSYLKFRKVYRMICNGYHLTQAGIDKILSIKQKGSSETSTQEI